MSQNEIYLTIVKILEEEGIEFKVFEHKPVHTSEEAAEERGVDLKTGVKSMIFKKGESEKEEDEYIMALVPGDKKVDEEKLEKIQGGELKLAPPDEVKRRTGCGVGSVPPFGFEESLETFMDVNILENVSVNFSAGSHTKSIQMNPADLKDITKAEKCRISKER